MTNNNGIDVLVEHGPVIKLGSPQQFVVSVSCRSHIFTLVVKAGTWQEAVLEAAKRNYAELGLSSPDDAVFDPAVMCARFTTIRSLRHVLWSESICAFSIGMIRPAVESINTGYALGESDGCPMVSRTTVNVAVDYIPLEDDKVYVP